MRQNNPKQLLKRRAARSDHQFPADWYEADPPSGAGKSLTLSLIAGLIRPDTGSVAINGRVVTDTSRRLFVSPQDRHVGMVFQDGLLLSHRSVLDNVALAVRQSSRRKERRAVARSWLERVGAEEWANRRPGSLSGGQRRRGALARGLAGECEIALLDELLSALDHAARLELRQLIREVISAAGVPALVVTHEIEEAEELGDTIISLSEGRVTGTRLVEHPLVPKPPRLGSTDTESA